jgi:hypothetical protein
MEIGALISVVQMAISAAPTVEDIAVKAKAFVTSLFKAGVITKDQQDSVHAHVDAYAAALLAGTPPPEYLVEPDPQ